MMEELLTLVTYSVSGSIECGAFGAGGEGGWLSFNIVGAWVTSGALLGGAESDLEGVGGNDSGAGDVGKGRTSQLMYGALVNIGTGKDDWYIAEVWIGYCG